MSPGPLMAAGAGGRALRAARTVVPRGTGTVGLWVAISGVLAYGFLALTGRALGAQDASSLSTLWVVGFLLGNATGLPLEQELSRAIASRRAQGTGIGPVIRRAAVAAGVFTLGIVVVMGALSGLLAKELFEGETAFVAALAGLFATTMAEYLVRGVLAGEQRFSAYGRLLGVEAGTRVVVVGALIAVGIDNAILFGTVLAVAPLAGILAALVGSDGAMMRQPGPEAPWRELTRALGWLLGASVLAQALVNLAPVFVRLFDPPPSVVSAFVASAIVARVPVFLFQAAQAVLVPRLSHHAGGGRQSVLEAETWALVRALGVLTVVGSIVAALLGPVVVRIGWGDGFALEGRDFLLLTGASCLYLIAVTCAAALIAYELPNRVVLGYAAGVVVFALCVALGDDVLTRVEVGFLAGAATAAATMAALCRGPFAAARVAAPVPDPTPEGQ